jgi:hypothetical protein
MGVRRRASFIRESMLEVVDESKSETVSANT